MKKTVVITGGNRGIGLSITEAYLRAGYNVVIGARDERDLQSKFGDKVLFVSTDVRSPGAHDLLVEKAVEEYGGIDTYINNAGFSEWRPIADIDEEFLDTLLDTNLKGVFWGCQASAKALASGGTIINISSLAAKRGSSNNSAYCASKFGVNGLTQSLAKELGPIGIRVNAVCPVLIPTEGLLDALDSQSSPAKGNPKDFIDNFAKTNSALLRLPSGAEIGDTCVFLSSDASAAITGQCINVDCGVFPQ